MANNLALHRFETISGLMDFLGCPPPSHPLVTLNNYEEVKVNPGLEGTKLSLDFYKVSFKYKFHGEIKYGQGNYDFQDGGLAFVKANQVVTVPAGEDSYEGYALYFHPDLFRKYPLANSIERYGFFSYDVSEALFLSSKEKAVISNLFRSIDEELSNNIDQYSQDVLISLIELLLNHSNRFYNRQFITRSNINHEIISSLDKILSTYFEHDKALTKGLPTVRYVSDELHFSQRYLSDLLRSLTGQNTQAYIQSKTIEHSKVLLSTTSLSVSEVSYKLGFEHPQSFSKFFKSRTSLSPLEFRQSFN